MQGKKIANWIVNIFVGFILLLVLIITINIIVSSVSGKGYNSVFGLAFLAVESESMNPEGIQGQEFDVPEGKHDGFSKGDLIFVQEKNDSTTYEVGDIITFYYDDETKGKIINTHRITQINLKDGEIYTLVTKGDNNITRDRYDIKIEDVIGKYNGTNWKGVGNFGLFLKEPVGYWLCIGVPAFAILLYSIISFLFTLSKRNKLSAEDEKEKIRKQILAEMGIADPQTVPATANAAPALAVEQTAPVASVEPVAGETEETLGTVDAEEITAEEKPENTAEEKSAAPKATRTKSASAKPKATTAKSAAKPSTTKSASGTKPKTATAKTAAKKSTTAKSSSKSVIGTGAKKK